MSISFRSFAVASLFAACALFAGDALAQGARAQGARGAAGGVPLKIRQMSKPGKPCLVPSPDIDGKVKSPGRNAKRKAWAMLEVEYVTAPEWLDEATFIFHALAIDTSKVIHYYTSSVTYVNIEKGEHGACVLIPPSFVKRYGEPISFGVEIEVNGTKVGEMSEGQGKGTPWWGKVESLGKVERHSGVMKDRSQTPFGLTHIDEYEAVR